MTSSSRTSLDSFSMWRSLMLPQAPRYLFAAEAQTWRRKLRLLKIEEEADEAFALRTGLRLLGLSWSASSGSGFFAVPRLPLSRLGSVAPEMVPALTWLDPRCPQQGAVESTVVVVPAGPVVLSSAGLQMCCRLRKEFQGTWNPCLLDQIWPTTLSLKKGTLPFCWIRTFAAP